MPFVDVPSKDDFASIWYTTNSRNGNVGSFDATKPTVVLLHPPTLESSWMRNMFEDDRLASDFNLIAFDYRVSGKSRARPTGLHDGWVDAADLAFAYHALHLPPAHILGVESTATNCALRLAILFPELCLSLTLCSVPPPTELNTVQHGYDESLQSWSYAEDLDSLEHAAMESARRMVGPGDYDIDLLDDIITYYVVKEPPCRRLRTVEIVNVLANRTPIKPADLARITQPVLIVQAENNPAFPLKYAQSLASQLKNAKNGAVVFPIRSTHGSLCVLPSNASLVNNVFVRFLARLPRAHSRLQPPQHPTDVRMKMALELLATISGDASIATRDPWSPLSFSCVTPEVKKHQEEVLELYAKDLHKAFYPLGPDGRPLRKYSEKQNDHWFSGGKDGISYAESDLVTSQQQDETEAEEPEISNPRTPLSSSEPISQEAAHEARLRRTTFNPNTVDKLVVKGSMSKVISSMPMHQRLRL
ncbi:hypothetical protein PLICRDRAFT_694103 [Plicaturopsis crispa FD-325 SS-3]|nr:hypothetical protein PLICRDRAFT_694103 [Plicaturopsis crispa FD-325 SS-3]